MRTPKRVAIAVSGLALAGSSALTLGAALPASAHTVQTTAATTSSHVVTDGWGWGWDDDWGSGPGWGWNTGWGGGWGGGWNSGWDGGWGGGWGGCGC
jgi:hypothetical protein